MTVIELCERLATIRTAISAIAVEHPSMSLQAAQEALNMIVCEAMVNPSEHETIEARAAEIMRLERVQSRLQPWNRLPSHLYPSARPPSLLDR